MSPEIQFLLYSLPDDQGLVQVVIKDETLWCTQKAMARLFDCSTDNIGLHLKNTYDEGELDKAATTEKISVVQKEGNRGSSPSTTTRRCPTAGTSQRRKPTPKPQPNTTSSTARSASTPTSIKK